MGEEALEDAPLVRHDLGARHRVAADHQHALAARARHREGVEVRAVEARLDVEREHAQARREVGGGELRVPVDASHARPLLECTLHGEPAPDAAVDQVAVGEAEVRFQAVDAGLSEPPAERRDVLGERHLDAQDRLARKGPELRRDEARARSEGGDPLRGGRRHEEIRHQPVVDDEHRRTILQHRVEVHHGATRDDTVRRREDEAALGHGAILLPSRRRDQREATPAWRELGLTGRASTPKVRPWNDIGRSISI